MGELLGTDSVTVSNWEKGYTPPAVRFYPKIIEYLGTNPLPTPTTHGEAIKREPDPRLDWRDSDLSHSVEVRISSCMIPRLFGAICCITFPLVATAQIPGMALNLTGSVGARFRNDAGEHVSGALLDAGLMLVRRADRNLTFGGVEVALDYSQMNVHSSGLGIRENSLELSAVADALLVHAGPWRLDAGVGVVLSNGLGCTTNGAGAQAAGSVVCVHSDVDNGTKLLGYRTRLTSAWQRSNAAFFVRADLSWHTVASGPASAPAVFAGLRYELRALNQ